MLQDRATRGRLDRHPLSFITVATAPAQNRVTALKIQVQIQIHYNTACICVMITGLLKYGHGGHFMPHLLGTIITCPYLDTGRGKSISEDYHFLLHHVSSSSLSSSSWWSSEVGQGPIAANQFSSAGFTTLVCVHNRRREGNNRWCCRNIKLTTQIIANCYVVLVEQHNPYLVT